MDIVTLHLIVFSLICGKLPAAGPKTEAVYCEGLP